MDPRPNGYVRSLLTNFVICTDIKPFLSGQSLHKSPERSIMERLLSDLRQHPLSWAFLQPVNAEEVPDYYEVIKEPMGTRFIMLLLTHPPTYS